MDYRLEDKEKFEAFKGKIAPFSRLVGDGHIFVSTDAHACYRTRRVNKWGHFSHIFVLAGSGFLFSEEYDEILIAADYRIDQQFIAHPWGSNSATNIYYDDGYTRLTTLESNLSRTQKMATVLTSSEALQSVSFCSNYRWRPDNCGRCQKCMRTKVMFFVATGSVPEIFAERSIPPSWFNISPGHHQLRQAHRQTVAAAERGRRLRDGEAATARQGRRREGTARHRCEAAPLPATQDRRVGESIAPRAVEGGRKHLVAPGVCTMEHLAACGVVCPRIQ